MSYISGESTLIEDVYEYSYNLNTLASRVQKLEDFIKKIIPFLPEEAQLLLEIEEKDKDGE